MRQVRRPILLGDRYRRGQGAVLVDASGLTDATVTSSGSIRSMSDIVPVATEPQLPVPNAVTLGADAPIIEELFVFAREAELRVSSLRMTIEERSLNARGDDLVRHEILVRHPGLARMTSARSDDPLSDDYDIWIGNGDEVSTYSARHKLASRRPRQSRVLGADAEDLPAYARTREPLTNLPPGSMAETFIHPHGIFRNVLVTGSLAVLGTRMVADREVIVVQADHPRSAKVLVDRPDRTVQVGIDRATGFLLLLIEQVGDTVTHHAEVTSLELDPDIPDSAFELHLSSDVRMLY